MTVDELAQEIRRVDGNNALGAGALAEALMPFLAGVNSHNHPRTNMTSPETLLPQAATDAAMKLAMDTLKQVPKRDPQVLEAHLTAVLIVFWGALWGTLGTEYARGFIEAQLRSMEDDVPHDVFVEAKAH